MCIDGFDVLRARHTFILLSARITHKGNRIIRGETKSLGRFPAMFHNQLNRILGPFSLVGLMVFMLGGIPAAATTLNFSVVCDKTAVSVVENSKPATVTCTISNTRKNSTFLLGLGPISVTNAVAVGGEAVDMVGTVAETDCTNGQTLFKKGAAGSSCKAIFTIPGVDMSGKNDFSKPPGKWFVFDPVTSAVNSSSKPNPETSILIKVTVTDPPKSAVPEPAALLLMAGALPVAVLWRSVARGRAKTNSA